MRIRRSVVFAGIGALLVLLIISLERAPRRAADISAGRLTSIHESLQVFPRNRQLTGLCLSPNELPLDKATVIGFGTTKDGIWDWRGQTDSKGIFCFSPPDDRDCELIACAEIYASTRFRIAASQTDLTTIKLDAGNRLNGIVYGSDGAPVGGAVVELRSADRGGIKAIDFGRDLAVKTLADGSFSTPPIHGRYALLMPQKFSSYLGDTITLHSDVPPVALNPIEIASDSLPSRMKIQASKSCSLEGVVLTSLGDPETGVPVVLSLLVGNRGVVMQDTMTNETGRYEFENFPHGADAVIEIYAQRTSSGDFKQYVPCEPTLDAVTQPGALILRKVTTNRSDLHWRSKQNQLSNQLLSANDGHDLATSERGKSLLQQIRSLKNAWTEMNQQQNGSLPREEFFEALLQTGRNEDEAEIALTALRFLMEVGGKGVNARLSQFKQLAMEVLVDRFLTDPNIDIVLSRGVSGGIPALRICELLRVVAERSPHRRVQAMAHLELAKLNLEVGRLIPVFHAIRDNRQIESTTEVEKSFQLALTSAIGEFQLTVEEANHAATRELSWLLEHADQITVPSLLAFGVDQGAFLYRSPSSKNDRTFAYIASHTLTNSPQLSTGKRASELHGDTIDGIPFSLDVQHGKIVVVAFTAQWCGPCRAERAVLRKFVEEFKDDLVCLVGVSGDHDRDEAIASKQSGETTWTTIWDGGVRGQMAETWNVHSWPAHIVIDSEGKIAAKGIPAAGLSSLVRTLLSNKSQLPVVP